MPSRRGETACKEVQSSYKKRRQEGNKRSEKDKEGGDKAKVVSSDLKIE